MVGEAGFLSIFIFVSPAWSTIYSLRPFCTHSVVPDPRLGDESHRTLAPREPTAGEGSC